jgi:glycosyltransferase involved in cell wall biosynthesis
MKIRKILSYLYRKLQNTCFGSTFFSWFYTRKPYPKTIPIINYTNPNYPKIAFICDEMTWQDFKDECNSAFVTPSNWLNVFSQFEPDILFCESTWRGIDLEPNCWAHRVYKNSNSIYENRKELLAILKHCKENRIKTVFWNKEDPVHFNKFFNTASKFDYVLTTAKECIHRYIEKGCKNVGQLSFGFSPKIFYPDESTKKENTAVFAGRWDTGYPERCREMSAIFDFVLAKNIELVIYNRASDSKATTLQFPQKYRQYVRPKVKFEELGEIFRKSLYAININTIKDSETMFARRVFELMACGCIIITNESRGLSSLFGDRIWFYNKDFDFSKKNIYLKQNIEYVFKQHTCRQKIEEILNFVDTI